MTEVVLFAAIAASVLVPGLVYRRFKGRFLTISESPAEKLAILEVAVAGLFMTVLMVPIYLALGIDPVTPLWLASTTASLITAIKANWAALLFHSFVVPVLLGIMSAYVERRGWLADALAKMGLQPMAKNPSPWAASWIFHQGVIPLVSVTLKDGQIIYGQFGPEASASVTHGNRDVFLDALYALDENGDLVRDEECSGVYIAGDEIRMVVFSDLPLDAPEDLEDASDVDPTNAAETTEA